MRGEAHSIEAAGTDIAAAERLLDAFATRTGIRGSRDRSSRYLWTDAYAVLAMLGLYRRTSRQLHLDRAMALANLVHHELGRFRPDDSRVGWISGLPEREGERLPTVGGLRIGKPLPERPVGAPLDERIEWERDGQYFHYLTRWMIALSRLGYATGEPQWNDWAIDLAVSAASAFVSTAGPAGGLRMHWKLSTDLSRALVPSMGQMDPVDGLATFTQLRVAQRDLGGSRSGAVLDSAIADMRSLCESTMSWATTDPLGIGGLLTELSQVAQATAAGDFAPDHLLDRMLADAVRSLDAYSSMRPLARPAAARLAFRELGLAIGLQGIEPTRMAMLHARSRFGDAHAVDRRLGEVQALREHSDLHRAIRRTWLDESAQRSAAWRNHEDINAVMLAASLVPDACLSVR